MLVTEWPEFGELDWIGDVRTRMRSPLVIDGRNFLDGEALCATRASRTKASAAEVQALVLAGGLGTRLRPLTTTVPKPVLPLAGRPFLAFMLDWLARHGVDEAILSCGFLGAAVERVLGSSAAG